MINIENEALTASKQKIDEKQPKENPVIKILGIVPGTNNLELDDKGLTIAAKNTTVTWEIADETKVAEIVDIVIKVGSEEVFQDRPSKEDKKWKGKTKSTVDKETKEYYSIHYKRPDDPVVYIYDPIIQINA